MARPRRRKQSDRTTKTTKYQRVHFDPIERLASMLVRPYRPIFDVVESFQQPLEVLDFYQPPPRARPGRKGFTLSPIPKVDLDGTRNIVAPPVQVNAGPLRACVQRHQRREVLHALNLTGKGSRARRRRRTAYSGVSC